MPLSQLALAEAATRPYREQATLNEAIEQGRKTAFLCHSRQDARLAKGFLVFLQEAGWNVYVDWLDGEMPSRPNRVTAVKLKLRIDAMNYFIFLATSSSMASRWCPWEIGYADGKKNIDCILLVRTKDHAGSTYGSEYLDLYREVDFSAEGRLSVWRAGETTAGVGVSSL